MAKQKIRIRLKLTNTAYLTNLQTRSLTPLSGPVLKFQAQFRCQLNGLCTR